MAKKNPGDLLTGDWNPIIGCERYSPGCKACWYLDGIFPWQQRLGNIPAHVKSGEHTVFEDRMSVTSLKTKNGIVGVVQHGDLFWDKVPTSTIRKILDIIDLTATMKEGSKHGVPKYILWTKRVERMATILKEAYPRGLPDYLAVSVSVEDQNTAQQRLPFLTQIRGKRIAMLEPMIGAVDLKPFIQDLDWVVVGSETGKGEPRSLNLDWVREVRDTTKEANKLFFIKQLGSSHKVQERVLDGVEWSEFPVGFNK